MRRTLLIALTVTFGSVGLLWAYLAIDLDYDDQSPRVVVTSYNGIFEEAVRRVARKEYAMLDQAARRRVLSQLASAKGGPIVREVALVRLRDLTDRDAALSILRKELPTLNDYEYEAAIGTLTSLGTPKAKALLDTLWKRLDAAPIAHTPLGDYRSSTLVGVHHDQGIRFEFTERSRLDADYSSGTVSEISLFLPNDPDYVFCVPNVDDVLGEFNNGRFVQALEGSPVPADIWTLPMLRTIASLRSRLDETMGILSPYFSPERFFKDQFILGKYGEHFVVACYKDKNLTVAEAVMSSFGKLGRDFGVSSWDSEGEKVHTVRNRRSGRTLSYAVVGPYFVTATDSTLMRRAIRTYVSDRRSSFAIDPIFSSTYGAVDQSGRREVLYVWCNPSRILDVIGSKDPSARRRAIVARALGRDLLDPTMAGLSSTLAHRMEENIAYGTAAGTEPIPFWRYVVDVRSLGRNHLDSLARLARMDVGRDIVPHLGSSMAIGYGGIEHLPQPYGFSNTAYNVVVALPLALTAPTGFDTTMRRFLSRVTSLDYVGETSSAVGATLWIARDTTTTDTLNATRKLQPSFVVLGGRTLVVATTPEFLRTAARQFAHHDQEPAHMPVISEGSIVFDRLGSNLFPYVTSYLLRTDRYMPEEIRTRFDPLQKAISTLRTFTWTLTSTKGLRSGSALLASVAGR